VTTTHAVLEGLYADPLPRATDDRAQIVRAILAAARANGDEVHASTIREHMDPRTSPRYVGVVVHRLVSRGVLEFTDAYRANGDPSTAARNATKQSPVWRLARPIDPEDITP
jgi:hypothetical protein